MGEGGHQRRKWEKQGREELVRLMAQSCTSKHPKQTINPESPYSTFPLSTHTNIGQGTPSWLRGQQVLHHTPHITHMLHLSSIRHDGHKVEQRPPPSWAEQHSNSVYIQKYRMPLGHRLSGIHFYLVLLF